MERIRFTVSVDPEVHAAFSEMAQEAGQSLSRAVGDWLRDTTEGSRFVSRKMRELRLSPAAAMRELHAYQKLDAEHTESIARELEASASNLAAEPASPRGLKPKLVPPSSNTGGKGGKPQAGSKP